MTEEKRAIIDKLQKDILLLQGFKPKSLNEVDDTGLRFVKTAFPNGIFPKGAIHEFINAEPEHAAAQEVSLQGYLNHS